MTGAGMPPLIYLDYSRRAQFQRALRSLRVVAIAGTFGVIGGGGAVLAIMGVPAAAPRPLIAVAAASTAQIASASAAQIQPPSVAPPPVTSPVAPPVRPTRPTALALPPASPATTRASMRVRHKPKLIGKPTMAANAPLSILPGAARAPRRAGPRYRRGLYDRAYGGRAYVGRTYEDRPYVGRTYEDRTYGGARPGGWHNDADRRRAAVNRWSGNGDWGD